jgi:dCMP deaminase
MIIGLTGRNASGKTEVALYLQKRGFQYFSLSDAIRQEIRGRGQEVTREVLIEVGNELRTRYGAGILAERILRQLREDRHYVVDSIRNPIEVETLKKRRDFVLLAIKADQKVRFERSRNRGREGAAREFEQFVREEERELESCDPANQQLIATERLADAVITNNADLTDLHAALDPLMARILAAERRPGWDEYFMNIARVVASRSNCIKRKVAAIIVKDKRVISTGYNGTPRGAKNCNAGGCPRCNSMAQSGTALEECLCSHGEENAITQAAYHGTSVKGATLYTTFAPCLLCTKMIINSGISEVVYNEDYPLNDTALSLLRECGVELRRFHYSDK